MTKRIPTGTALLWQTPKHTVLCALVALLLMAACKSEPPKPVVPGELTTLPFKTIAADTLEEAIKMSKGWLLVGNVFMNPAETRSITTEAGKEVLLYNGDSIPGAMPKMDTYFPPSGGKRFMLRGVAYTGIAHADIDIEMDFMLAKDSKFAVMFKSRYALMLTGGAPADSVYQKSTGTPPMLSLTSPEAYRAPGLWQHLRVRFIAPRFDAAGKKIAEARFEDIELNGQALPASVVGISQGTKGNEEPQGPLFLNVRGAAAFRNIRYKPYNDHRLAVSNVQYAVYKGIFKEYDTLRKLTPLRTGTTDSLHWKVGDKRAQITFAGTLKVPVTGGYLFRLRAGGPAWLLVDDREIVKNNGTRDFMRPFYDSVYLKAGDHRFEIIYANYDQSLVLDYEGPHIPFTRLTDPVAERHEESIDPLEYTVSKEPGIQRGFFEHHNKINTYTMAVGIPGGLNYAYDLNTYGLLSVWRGRFIDVANMWTSRGESQRELPLGAVLELSGIPSLQSLADVEDVWQDTVAADKSPYTNRGYRIDTDGLPVFRYTFNGASVEESWKASPDSAGLVHRVTVSYVAEVKNVYFLLGNGSKVEALPQGGYAIDDKAYYLTAMNGVDLKDLQIIKAQDGRQALALPLAGIAGKNLSFQYTILW